ncbi:hypothetical protein BU25DRAFT_418854 [Macroventuria anomochaeta]|uniref:Uncharacterized protein n=1 Tax=Macroventuria anomochaeta TaxID=301207 RepID=A0ACB6SB29_9PLEO|nr:uncharacterized protein BU25DRAFT_418854 [Macroventuria anomochaeta]KAF2631248.1 hypothetical protein BU25DRAFT_418854 [Macroventuria anomochaeta]
MGFFHFHRPTSSSSSSSASSALSFASSHTTPRTSTDSASDYMTATLKHHLTTPRAPLLNLPFEILQHIASYLDDASAAKFSLSSRQICYAVGTNRLSSYIASSASRFDARDRLEETIERALPGSWHCAWCDKFHVWSAHDGPAAISQMQQSPCAKYNSYLADRMGYTLCYHHIRLALVRHKYGPAHGLEIGAFEWRGSGSVSLFRTPVHTTIAHQAEIRDGRFLLHTNYSILLPTWAASHKNLIGHLWPLLPPLLTQHRASEYGHTGVMAALDNVVRRGWRVLGAQSCSDCQTDWSVTAFPIPRSVAGEFVRLNIQTWRDLGTGKTPFDTAWRAHGPYIHGTEESCVREEVRRERGSIREAFEGSHSGKGEGRDEGVERGSDEWEKLAYSWQLDKRRGEEKDQEKEWRAIWRGTSDQSTVTAVSLSYANWAKVEGLAQRRRSLPQSDRQRLVEASGAETAHLWRANVSYLHRTVKDFLAPRDIWSEVCRAAGPDFNHHAGLFNAQLMRLEVSKHSNFKSEDTWEVILSAISYATQAEVDGSRHQIEMLDDLDPATDKIMGASFSRGSTAAKSHDSDDYWMLWRYKGTSSPSFLELAVRLQLPGYVTACLEAMPKSQSKFEPFQLYHPAVTRYEISEVGSVELSDDLLHHSIDCKTVRLLLRYADPKFASPDGTTAGSQLLKMPNFDEVADIAMDFPDAGADPKHVSFEDPEFVSRLPEAFKAQFKRKKRVSR